MEMPQIQSVYDWFSNLPSITITFLILAVLGIFLSILFFLKARRIKKPKHKKKSYNLFKGYSSKISDLSIKYKNANVDTLTITKVVFWNDGKETIRSDDIAAKDPVIITVDNNHKMLDAEIIHCNQPANNFQISQKIIDDKYIHILYDYIDLDEGTIIQLTHTGISSEDIQLKGIIKGYGNISTTPPKSPPSKRRTNIITEAIDKAISTVLTNRYIKILFFIVSAFFLYYLTLDALCKGFIFKDLPKEISRKGKISFFFFLPMVIVYSIAIYKDFTEEIPKGLEVFEERFDL